MECKMLILFGFIMQPLAYKTYQTCKRPSVIGDSTKKKQCKDDNNGVQDAYIILNYENDA